MAVSKIRTAGMGAGLAGDDGWGDFDFDGLEAAPARFTESGFARDIPRCC